MSSSATNPTNISSLHFLEESKYKIPSKNYGHTMTTEIKQISTNSIEKRVATIELCVQGFYKLFVQPFKDFQPLPTERGFIGSPVYKYNFDFPLLLATKNPAFLSFGVSQRLATLPISKGLASYIEPLIVQNGIEIAQISGEKEFKIIFNIKVVEIDLADYHECDGYRRHGLV